MAIQVFKLNELSMAHALTLVKTAPVCRSSKNQFMFTHPLSRGRQRQMCVLETHFVCIAKRLTVYGQKKSIMP